MKNGHLGWLLGEHSRFFAVAIHNPSIFVFLGAWILILISSQWPGEWIFFRFPP
jgi:hypothetical protein